MNKNYRLKYIKDGELKAAVFLKKQALSHFTEKLTIPPTLKPQKETFTFEEVRAFVSEFVSICSEYIAERIEEQEIKKKY